MKMSTALVYMTELSNNIRSISGKEVVLPECQRIFPESYSVSKADAYLLTGRESMPLWDHDLLSLTSALRLTHWVLDHTVRGSWIDAFVTAHRATSLQGVAKTLAT